MQLPEPDSMTPAWPDAPILRVVYARPDDFVGCFDGTDIYVGKGWRSDRNQEELMALYCAGDTTTACGWASVRYFASSEPSSPNPSPKSRRYLLLFASMHQALTQ